MISSNSAFYYGIQISDLNNFISFDEGGGEILAKMRSGKYTLSTFLNEVLRSMNEAGENIYTGSVNRSSRVYTIQSNDTFSLLVASASTSASAFETMGFTGADRTALDTYFGNMAVGSVYRPQFRLQSFTSFDDNQKAVEATVNTSASGQVEVVRFGIVKLMECEIMFITDMDQGVGAYIRTDLFGISNARNFLQYAVTKGPMEFIADVMTPESFRYCILESTAESKDGVDFKLKEMISKNIPGYYQTGLLTFREVLP